MSKRDDEILRSIGMTGDDVDAIADACERGDYSIWDGSRVSCGSPLEEEMPAEVDFSESVPNPYMGLLTNSGACRPRTSVPHQRRG